MSATGDRRQGGVFSGRVETSNAARNAASVARFGSVQRRQHRAGHEQVEVDEVAFGAAQEILVRQVAAADDGDCAVGDEELVMQAMVQTPKSTSGPSARASVDSRPDPNPLNS